MSVVCEIVEVLAVGVSDTPAMDAIIISESVGSCTSGVAPGITPPITVATAVTTSQVVIDAYAVLLNVAQTTGEVSSSLVVAGLFSDAARGRSIPFATINVTADSAANVTDEIAAMDIPQLLSSAMQATSSVVIGTLAIFQANETAEASSTVGLGLSETATTGADASATITILRRVEETVINSAGGSTEVTASSEPQFFLLLSTGNSASIVMLQADTQLTIDSAAEVTASTWYKDPDKIAWVMNTETAAASWYNNFDFESIAQPGGKTLAVGPDGLYELAGTTDSGEQIDAEVVSGFADFDSVQTKRVDALYFGYTSDGQIAVTAETYESGHPPVTYFLEQRAAGAPRNSRVVLGKGLWGRYWRMTIRNVSGAEFEIHDAIVDVAISSRRV